MRPARTLPAALAALLAALAAGGGYAHDPAGVPAARDAAAPLVRTASAQPPAPLPFRLGGTFDLVDQHGNPRNQSDPEGRAQLLFFGYANCAGICTTALPVMADATDILAARGLAVRPVMITVDPARDRVDNMAAPMARLHPDFVGLTGAQPALERAYRAFSVERRQEYVDPEYGPVFSHGSFIYLLDGEGGVLTLFPPILSPERVADIVQGYIAAKE